MTPRVRILVFGLLGAVLVWNFWPTFHGLVFGPLDALSARVTSLDAENEKKTQKQLSILQAQRQLKDWRSRSLPSDRLSAATMYQNWLIELAAQHKLTAVKVTAIPDQRAKGNTYYGVSATLQGEGTLKQFRDFVYDFEKSGLLHRVKSMALDSTQRTGDPSLKGTLAIEGLALLGAKPRSTLIAQDIAAPQMKPQADYDGLANKNLFVRGYNGPPAPKEVKPIVVVQAPSKPVEAPFDNREFIRLTALIDFDDGTFEAWLYDVSSNTRVDLFAGKPFKIGGIEGMVIAITNEYVTLQIKKEEFQLAAGKSFKELQKLESSPSTPAPKSDPAPSATKPTDVKPGDAKPSVKPAETKPSGEKPSSDKPADAKPAAEKPATAKPDTST